LRERERDGIEYREIKMYGFDQGLYATWKSWNLKIDQKVMEYRKI
jgi:hypothetical protein